MAEERKLSKIEIKDAIAVAMAAAFGFVIALIWKEFVMAGLDLAGIYPTTVGASDPWVNWAIFGVVAVIITVIMVVLILLITKWGKKPEE
jgi:intracellular septation protein A